MNNKIKRVVLFFLVIILLIVVAVIIKEQRYHKNIEAVDKNSKAMQEFIVDKGDTGKIIAMKLKQDGLIKNEKAFVRFVKKNGKGLNAGHYNISKSMNVKKIVKILTGGSNNLISFRIKEGENMPSLIKRFAIFTNKSTKEVDAYLRSDELLDELMKEYPFLDNIKDKQLYYPLEGYLMPDTYSLERDRISVKTILKLSLDQMKKNLEGVKNPKETLTLASMIELEAVTPEDRKMVSSVFHNRLKKGMTLGSDVTSYYGSRVSLSDRDLNNKELEASNPYNTRGRGAVKGLPIGPICFPSKVSIDAAVNPSKSNYLFFVADKNGKVYYNITKAEHVKTVNELKAKNEWYRYGR